MRVSNAVWMSAALAVSGCATTYEAKWDEKPAATAASETDALIAATAEGDAAWDARADKAKLQEAITKWEAAFEKGGTGELAAKLARAHYLLGDGYYALENNQEGRDAEFTKAMTEGKKHAEAITLAPKEAVPAMYWYATNLGKWAATKGFATRLRYKDDIKATMLHVKALDENFFYAAPWRYFGGFEAATAGLAGGSLEKSEENFKKSVELAPAYLGTKVLWADYLCTKKQDKETFKKLLEEVIAADAKADPAIEPENNIEQQKAKKLLAEIDEKF